MRVNAFQHGVVTGTLFNATFFAAVTGHSFISVMFGFITATMVANAAWNIFRNPS